MKSVKFLLVAGILSWCYHSTTYAAVQINDIETIKEKYIPLTDEKKVSLKDQLSRIRSILEVRPYDRVSIKKELKEKYEEYFKDKGFFFDEDSFIDNARIIERLILNELQENIWKSNIKYSVFGDFRNIIEDLIEEQNILKEYFNNVLKEDLYPEETLYSVDTNSNTYDPTDIELRMRLANELIKKNRELIVATSGDIPLSKLERKDNNGNIIKEWQKPQLNQYAMFLASKWFETLDDHVNLVLGCPRFKGNMDKFFYNPIKTFSKLEKYFFPNITTYYEYHELCDSFYEWQQATCAIKVVAKRDFATIVSNYLRLHYGNQKIQLQGLDIISPGVQYKITAPIFYENIVVDYCPYIYDELITFVLAEDVIYEDGNKHQNIVTTELTNQQIKNIEWDLFKEYCIDKALSTDDTIVMGQNVKNIEKIPVKIIPATISTIKMRNAKEFMEREFAHSENNRNGNKWQYVSLDYRFHPDIVDLDTNLTYRYTDNVETPFAYDEDNIVFYTKDWNGNIIQLPGRGE